jgi:hypothetical protein
MIVGAYPFEDPDDPNNFRKTIMVSGITTFLPIKLNLVENSAYVKRLSISFLSYS